MNSAIKVEKRAENAARLAKQGRDLRQKWHLKETSVSATEDIMKGEPIAVFTGIFCLSILIEIFVSWEGYRDISSANAPRWAALLTPSMALIIILWAALTSFFLSKRLKTSLFELEKGRLEGTGLGSEEAYELTFLKTQKHFKIGLITGIVLLVGVIFLSYYRIHLLEQLGKAHYSIADLLLPVLFVVLEILSGFYFGYFWFRNITLLQCKQYEKAFQNCKNQCNNEVKMAVSFYKEAKNKGEDFTPSKHLKDAIYRWNNLSIEDDDYFDPIQPPTQNGVDKKKQPNEIEQN